MDRIEVAPQPKPALKSRGGALAVACITVALQIFILGFVIPRFAGMFKEMDFGELPPPTNALFFIAHNIILLSVCLALLVAALFQTRQVVLLNILSGAMILFCGFEVIALFMPMIGQMERLPPK